MSSNKGQKFPPEILNHEEISRFFKTFSRTTFTGIRNAALFAIFLRGLLRCNEALELRPCDVNSENGIITILNGKGKKRRVVGIDEAGCQYLQNWENRIKHISTEFYFCTTKGRRMCNSYVRAAIKRHALKAGIFKRVHAHGLRHSGACQLAEEGIDLRIIQRQLGHSNLAVTDRYLQHLNPTEVINAMRKRTTVF